MEKFYIIICRYEYVSFSGKKYSNWFVHNLEKQSKDKALEEIKQLKTSVKDIDRKTKLKHEYDIKLYDEYINEFNKNLQELEQIKKRQQEYFKSNEYKELQKKKRIAKKELKERQKKYLEEHTKPAN